MRRNTDGLKRSARLRSDSALARATTALHRMEAADQKITFRAVSLEARVSTAWLYGRHELRERIMRSRKSDGLTITSSLIRDRERLSRQNVVATLRLRIKALEERNRELSELLERAYGVIAQT
ncbi:MAG: DUF6262 family protein [Acidobacteriia bacterium]|nr:DUF6262 family protein [Terriglobia bacterium]